MKTLSKRGKKKQSHNHRFIFFFFICLLILSLFLVYKFYIKDTSSTVSAPVVNPIPQEEKDPISISVTAIGDIMCHNTQYKDAFNSSTNNYDFSYVFNDIDSYFKEKDLVIGNLETTFAGSKRGYSSYPTFNTPEHLATDLKELGLDVVSTANNHSLDTGYSGIVSTLDQLDQIGISHMGTSRTPEDQDTILVKEVNRIKIAFLSYTYGTNGIKIPDGKPYCVNLIDKELILHQIQKAKEQNVDVILANVHWGVEYRLKPTDEQENLADFMFKNGVDIILGSHPHVLEPMEKKKVTTTDGEEKECFVIYSLGNFMSGQVKENTRNSIILDFTITKMPDDSIKIENIFYTPIYCYTSNGDFKGYELLDLRKQIELYDTKKKSRISSSKIDQLRKELVKIETLMDSRMEKTVD